MVDTTFVLGAAVLVVCLGIAVAMWRFAATGARPLLPLALAALGGAVVFAVGATSELFRPQRAAALTGLSLVVAGGLAVQWYRER